MSTLSLFTNRGKLDRLYGRILAEVKPSEIKDDKMIAWVMSFVGSLFKGLSEEQAARAVKVIREEVAEW